MSGRKIEKNDVVTEQALQRIRDLVDELSKVVPVLENIIRVSKSGESSIGMADSLKKIQTETSKVIGVQKQLEDAQKTMTDAVKKRAAEDAKAVEDMVQKREYLRRAIKDLKKDQQEDLDLLKSQIITRQEYQKRIKESTNLIATYQQRIALMNKSVKEELILTKQLGGEYTQLITKLSQAEAKYKDLLASSKANGNEVLAAGAAYAKLNQQVRTIDELMGKFHRNVGNYPKILQTMTRSILDLVAAFGIHDGIRMFAHSVREVIALSIDFESANSRLAGVLGLQKAEIIDLRHQQMELAKVTLYNAAAYAELQIELAKLGFPIKDIEAMTESTAKASIAMGSGLAEQAELTGSVLHQYNLAANQTTRINDALSKSTTTSALDFKKLATAMPYVGSAASALGFSLEETLALMGQLANTGLAASTIGTSLRKIFLLLADSSSNLSKKFKEPVRDLPSLLKGLKELRLNNTELAEALELTDIRSVIAFQSLIDGADKVQVLNKQIEDSVGFTNELAHTVKDNLGGDLKLAKSAVDSLAISMGETLEPAARSLVKGLTAFLRALAVMPRFLKENWTLLLALGFALIAFRTAAVATTLENIAMSRSFQLLSIRLGMALNSFRAFTVAMATNPFAVLFLSIAGVITAMNLYERTLGRTAQISKLGQSVNKSLAETYERLNQALADVTVNEAEYARLTEKEKTNRIDIIKLRIAEAEAMAIQGEETLRLLKYKAEELSLGQQNRVLKLQEMGKYDEARQLTKELADENRRNNDEYSRQQKEVTANVIKLNDLARGLRNTIKSYEDLEKALQATTNKELTEEEFKRDAQRRKALLDLMMFRKQVELKAQEEIISNENETLSDRLEAVRNAEKIRNEIVELERKKSLIIEKKNEVMAAGEVQKINEQAEFAKTENAKRGKEERIGIVKQETEAKLKEEEAYLIRLAEVQMFNLQYTVKLEQEAIKKRFLAGKISREQADRELAKLTLKRGQDILNLQIKLLQEELLTQQRFEEERLAMVAGNEKEEKKIREEGAKERRKIEEEIANLKIQLTNEVFENTEHLMQDEIELLNKVLGVYQTWASALNDLFNSISDRRLAKLDKEIRQVNDWEQEQVRLAGDNDKAKERIEQVAEARRQALEKKKIAEQRKSASREKILTLFEIGIRTALNIVKAFPNFGLMAAAAALGTVQAAAVIAKPLPQFKDGGVTKDPYVIAGEEGHELYRTPDGKWGMTENKATIMHVPIGTEFFDHRKTMRMVAEQGLEAGKVDSTTIQNNNVDIDRLIRQQKNSTNELKKVIAKNKPANIYKQGSLLMAAKEDENRNVELIRLSNLGKRK